MRGRGGESLDLCKRRLKWYLDLPNRLRGWRKGLGVPTKPEEKERFLSWKNESRGLLRSLSPNEAKGLGGLSSLP